MKWIQYSSLWTDHCRQTGHIYKYTYTSNAPCLSICFWSFEILSDRMNRFHLNSFFTALLLLLLVFSSTIHAIPRSFSRPSARTQQAFHPSKAPFSSSQARDFQSQKRRVPTGSNPLHNKRRWSITPSSDNMFMFIIFSYFCMLHRLEKQGDVFYLYSSFDLENSITITYCCTPG